MLLRNMMFIFFGIIVVEVFGITLVSSWIGGWNTLLLIVITSLLGIAVARFEGMKVLEDAKQQMREGKVPGRTFIDGICILIGGWLLIIPGFITDIIGFTLAFPLTRPLYRSLILMWIMKKMKDGRFTIYRR
ncbi:membrane protein FxsA [Paenibacillus selenitireducens]|uniref:Membrane protein FxsA n=1 Tax=Paenibacillus selenitireducens TaxID=1324314 RepID=A0A1T2XMJ0_9BACL|nr:FxsA family protein [Paenibacillus selenitireducens]OPA80883.1 membrane protein FxsA [Paenibacillus selenitireducens]